MNNQRLHSVLNTFSARLVTDTPQRERDASRVNQMLSRSLLRDDVQQLKGSSFAFEGADLFAPEPGFSEGASAAVAADVAQEPEFRAFMREVPVRSTQLHASVPLWAGGAAVDRTVGPLIAADGRQLWFDFLKIEKLVALYIQNHSNPSLLFNMRTGSRFVSPLLPLLPSASTFYTLGPGSIWIDSQIFATDAPAGFYTGLTIRGGRVTLTSDPQTINGRATIAPSCWKRLDYRVIRH